MTRDEIVALFARRQVAVTHSLAMKMLGRTRREHYLNSMDRHGNLAVKLLRTFTAQTEALAKLRAVIETLRTGWVKGPFQPRPETPPVILAAAIASTAIETAGEIADGVIFNLFPLSRYAKAIEWLRRGRAKSGRDAGGYEVCHFTTCYLGDDRQACLDEAKRMLARYANLPFYGNMLAKAGFANEVEAVRAAMKARDVPKAEREVSNAMADAVTLCGKPEACRERLDEYGRAGATLIVAFPNPVGESRAAATLRAIEGLARR